MAPAPTIADEAGLRAGIFVGAFVLLAVMETLRPDRPRALSRLARWPGAVIILIAGSVLARLIAPAGLIGIAAWAEQNGLGLFNLGAAPALIVFLLTILVLDLAVYAQHRATHAVTWLWRIHRVHHTDVDVDVTTALRFHPLEILVSLAWKGLVVAALGAPPIAVLVFEILLNASAMFNHANLRLPAGLDQVLRLIVVTPAMHRRHHGSVRAESDTNFGFFLAIWDRVFATYGAAPPCSPIGQTDRRAASDQTGWALLIQPLRADAKPRQARQ